MAMTVHDGNHFDFKNELFGSTKTSCVLTRLLYLMPSLRSAFCVTSSDPGVQISRSSCEKWGSERRPRCHLHAHGAPGHVHHAGLCTDWCSTQPNLWWLCFQGAVSPH